jgi:CHASE2 domain-containing sensor protein
MCLLLLSASMAYGSCAHALQRPRLIFLLAILTAIAGVQLGCVPHASQVGDYFWPLVPALAAGKT